MTRPELLVAQCGPAAFVCVPCSVHSTQAAMRGLEDVCLCFAVLFRAVECAQRVLLLLLLLQVLF
jgi:hypothetical protein